MGRSRSRSRGRSRSRSRDRRRRHDRSRSRRRSRSRSRGGRRSPRSPSPGAEFRPRRRRSRARDRSSSRSYSRSRSRSRQRGCHRRCSPDSPGRWQYERRGSSPEPWLGAGADAGGHWRESDTAGRRGSGWGEGGAGREHSRGSDSDRGRDWDAQRSRRFRDNETPSASIFVKGLPEDADESDLYQLFQGQQNLVAVRVLRDRQTGLSKCMAFVDFAAVDDARLLMESEQRWQLQLGGQRLLLDYSHSGPGGRAGGEGGAAQLQQDWICDMCQSINFARRLECYHCSTARPANPRRVTTDLNEPSNILKISGLELHTGEEGLYNFCAAVVPNIVDLRVIKDKFTGVPRGFAFVELGSIADAGRLMLACQGQQMPGQQTPLKVCYAKAKDQLLGSAAGPGAADADGRAPDALPGDPAAVPDPAAAAALSWKPKEFDAAAVLDSDTGGTQAGEQQQGQTAGSAAGKKQPQPAAAAAASAVLKAAASAAASVQQAAAAAAAPSSEAAASAAAAAAAGVDAATIQALTGAGFSYQASSGYWYDAKSGYFYDAASRLYYHHSTGQWYAYDSSSGQYTAVGQQQQQQQTAAAAPASSSKQAAPAGAAAAAVADKRRRAVIGSAPQYNPEGLLAAAALAKERDDEQKRIAAAKAARERQQQQQNKQRQQQQQLAPGKPGIGALPGTGSTPLPAAQVVADGNVQGVVYKSKWAQRQQQQQHQS